MNVRIAQQLREETAIRLNWMEGMSRMGRWLHVLNQLYHARIQNSVDMKDWCSGK